MLWHARLQEAKSLLLAGSNLVESPESFSVRRDARVTTDLHHFGNVLQRAAGAHVDRDIQPPLTCSQRLKKCLVLEELGGYTIFSSSNSFWSPLCETGACPEATCAHSTHMLGYNVHRRLGIWLTGFEAGGVADQMT